MKKLLLIIGVLAVLLTPLFVLAQTNDPALPPPPVSGSAPAASVNALLLALIPLIVPLLVEFGKWALPFVPLWILPILAAALGVIIDWVASLIAGGSASPLTATIAGGAGVGLREMVDQINKRIKAGKPIAPPGPTILLLFALGFTLSLSGCAWFHPEKLKPAAVAPGHDAALVNAERMHVSSFETYKALTNWELNSRLQLPAEVSRAVDRVRAEFPPAWREADRILEDYRFARGVGTNELARVTAALSAAQNSMLRLKADAASVGPVFTALTDLTTAINELRKP